mgnify:FL=1
MSESLTEYEDYDCVSKYYDNFRVPVGTDYILNIVKDKFPNKNLKELSLLDCGCGTGNYLNILSDHFGVCVGFEMNKGMYNTSSKKLEKKENVKIINQSVLELENNDNLKFDVAIITQVLHHLDDDTTNFKNLNTFLSQVSSLLKNDGLLIINTCNPEILKYGYWFFDLLPDHVVKQYCDKYAPIYLLAKYSAQNNLELFSTQNIYESTVKSQIYLDEFGVLNDNWRKCDSIWSLISNDDLSIVKDNVQKMIEKGSMKEYINNCDKNRYKYGQTLFLTFSKI